MHSMGSQRQDGGGGGDDLVERAGIRTCRGWEAQCSNCCSSIEQHEVGQHSGRQKAGGINGSVSQTYFVVPS